MSREESPDGRPRPRAVIEEVVVMPGSRPVRPAARESSVREEVADRPSRPRVAREEVAERPSRPLVAREEVAERPSRPQVAREEVTERPLRPPGARDEVLGRMTRPSRPPLREEMAYERPSRPPVREEVTFDSVPPRSAPPMAREEPTFDTVPPRPAPPVREVVVTERPSRPPTREEVTLDLSSFPPTSDAAPGEVPAARVAVVPPAPGVLTGEVSAAQLEALEARVAARFEARLQAMQTALDARPVGPVAAGAVVETPRLSGKEPPPGIAGRNRIDRFLKLMNDRGASDLHLSVGRPPIFRLGGRMEPIRYRTITEGDFKALLQPITPPHLWQEYVATGDADFAYELPGVCRFRVNAFKQERGMSAVFRVIPTKLMTVEQLGLPPVLRRVVDMTSGLVLVTGPTGSGKSTTLSAIINEMNERRPMHFVTIEDPIEFVHPNKTSLMSQREIGPHSKSFSAALRAAVREDPDAILVGEMRDLETISMALNAAETGVLVFGTLHTNSAAKTLDRIINVFPSDKQAGVRGTLASVTKCVVAQQLLRKKGGGRVAAVEILFASPAMSSMVRDGKTHQISGQLKLGKREGMIAMDDALRKLVEEDLIEPQSALEKSIDKDDMRKWLRSRGTELADDAH